MSDNKPMSRAEWESYVKELILSGEHINCNDYKFQGKEYWLDHKYWTENEHLLRTEWDDE